MNYVLPILILLLLVYNLVKKQNNVAIFVIIELFRASGISAYLQKIISPVFTIFGIPSELCELIVLKPFSGSGSLALLSDIFTHYGVDSYIGRCASVIISSSETVFYVTSVYFSKTKVKNLGYAIPLALFVTFLSSILACLFCKIF